MKPAAHVLAESGRQTIAGVTLARTDCCDLQAQRVLVDPERVGEPILAAWFDGEGNQITKCPCGRPLPPAQGWRPSVAHP